MDASLSYASVVEEYTGTSTTPSARYDYGDDLVRMDRGGVYYYLYDGLGSTRQLVNAAGAVTDTYGYSAFGELAAHTGSTVNPFLFNAQQFDQASGDYYLRARYYDQSSGRFISQDPLEGNRFFPISLHRYVYTSDNPSNRIDPSGAGDNDNLIGLSAGIAAAAPLITAELPAIQGGLANASMNLSAEEQVAVAGSEDVASVLQADGEDFVELYHGTSRAAAQAIRQEIDFDKLRNFRDFDINNITWKNGFYTTTNLQQAERWAENNEEDAAVIKFRVPISEFDSFFGKIFRGPTQEWQDFVRGGRYGSLYHSFDYVFGPLLKNSKNLVGSGSDAIAHPEEWDQISFHTERAVQMLHQYIVPGYPQAILVNKHHEGD